MCYLKLYFLNHYTILKESVNNGGLMFRRHNIAELVCIYNFIQLYPRLIVTNRFCYSYLFLYVTRVNLGLCMKFKPVLSAGNLYNIINKKLNITNIS